MRRLLIIGASSAAKAAAIKGAPAESWLARMLSRKPRMLVIVALANKIARVAWALMAHGGTYRALEQDSITRNGRRRWLGNWRTRLG